MKPAGSPPFLDELSTTWGAAWGAWDDVGELEHVLVRQPGSEFETIRASAWSDEAGALVDPDGDWYWTDRRPPDLDLIHAQHAGLLAALRSEGVKVLVAPPLGGRFVKSVYVRDPMITVPGGAVIGRMGVRMRRGEEPDITRIAAGAGLPILSTIVGRGTLEGGSFVKLAPGLAALGLSIRCNREGAEQLRTVLECLGWKLLFVPLAGYSIHLDLHLAMVDRRRALIDVEHLPYSFLEALRDRSIELIPADPREPWALNCLALRPGVVLMAAGSPQTQATLARAGVRVITVPYDELHKNGGGVHCSTMELVRRPADP